MYGFDVSKLIQATISSNIEWIPFPLPIMRANCGFLYDVDLYARYGTDSHPAPGLTDKIVIIRAGQLLHCNATLVGSWYREHPVTCKIKDSVGNVVFEKTKWLTAGGGDETDFFRNASLPIGSYDVDWDVCAGHASHKLTVSAIPPDYTTNDIDIEIVVTDTAGIDPYNAWNAIEADVISDMLIHNATVKLKSAEIKGKYLVIFHLKVTAPPDGSIGSIGIEPLSTAIILLLLITFVTLLVTVPSINQVRIAQLAYNTTFHKFTYEECADMEWVEWTACMAATYPVVWNDIKDKIEAPKPPPPNGDDWMDYIMYIIIAVGAMAGVVIFVKYVMPALKVKR